MKWLDLLKGEDKTYQGHKEINSYIGLENKQNRIFIGLPLNKKKMISQSK